MDFWVLAAPRWLTPDLINLVVRPSDGSQATDSMELDRISGKQQTSQPDDGESVKKSLSASTTASGRQTPPTSPAPASVALDATPSPAHGSNPHGSQPAGDADDDQGSAVTPTSSMGSQAASSVKPVPSFSQAATVIATLKVPDAMGPNTDFDGTPVSSRHTSPCVSPRSKAAQPQDVPHGCAALQGFTFSAYPAAEDCKPGLEAPEYERAKQRVLIIGAGFGRELNPQQGQETGLPCESFCEQRHSSHAVAPGQAN